MRIRTILDGNAFYEIDEECMEKQEEAKKSEESKGGTTKLNIIQTIQKSGGRRKENR